MKTLLALPLLALQFFLISCSDLKTENKYVTETGEEGGFTYEFVTNDPTNTRIYTLNNGLKVYLSVYKNAPRVQVYMPVKAGGKNDPSENTGLAHYLEHMMFKGTDKFGTIDYNKEVVYLDSIETMFNRYSKIVDSKERKEFYKNIDAISNEAANFAIPNEYDKLISTIGGKGLNAYTTDDRTVYMVDIPSNEINRFLEIEANRFEKIVNRLFHTELEAVYEEKNRSLDSDNTKAYHALNEALFKKHQYGTQTVIGTIEHLKNPSITEIKNYFDKYYVPNNIAICMSGDLDPTETMKTITKYFSDWKPNKELTEQKVIKEDTIAEPIAMEVYGPDSENITMGYRFPFGTGGEELIKLEIVDMILNNAEAGLIDLNLLQKQKVLNAGTYVNDRNDYSVHTFFGNPKNGQTLEEVQNLILGEIEKVKKGEFEDWLIDAVVTDFKKTKMQALESNSSRANEMVMAFTNDIPWVNYVDRMERMEKITKKDIVEFTNKYYNENYAIVFKRNGEDPNKVRVEKPFITKVPLTRDSKSDFHKAILTKGSPTLQPVFINYEEDVKKGKLSSGIEVLANQNVENELFSLYYVIDLGSNNDPALKMAVQYLEFIGTEKLTAEQFKKELYKIGCSFSVSAGSEQTYISLSGLDENMEKSIELFENLLANAIPNKEALKSLVGRLLKGREDAKRNKGTILFTGLMNYGQYGSNNPFTNVLSNAELSSIEGEELVSKIKEIPNLEHRILYYGPRSVNKAIEVLNKLHKVPQELKPLPELVEFEKLNTSSPKVYWTHYDMVQTEFLILHNGNKYDKSIEPEVRIFNQYFGSIVFQEIREAQGLAYSVFSSYSTPSKAKNNDLLFAYVGAQADKQGEAMSAMKELLDNMPESPEAFEIAKQAILSKIESERITKSGILWNYESAKKKGVNYDIRRDIYDDVKKMEFHDLKEFQQKYVADKSYNTVLIGNKDKINFDELEKYGDVQELTLEEIFGYDKVESVDLELQ